MKCFYLRIIVCLLLFPALVHAQWRQAYHGTDTSNSITGISFYTAKEGFVAFRKHIGYTTDSGHTMIKRYVAYNNVDFNGYNVNLLFGFYPAGVHAFSANNVILFGDYGFEPSILISNNGGQTWKLVYHRAIRQEASHLLNSVSAMAFPSDKLTGFAVQGDEILKTFDGGNSWQTVRYNYDQQLSKISFLDSKRGYVMGPSKLYQSIDGGTSWTVLNSPQSMTNIEFTSATNGYLFTDFGFVYKTKDGGNSWTKMNGDLNKVSPNDVHFINDSTGYISTSAYAVYSTNNSGRSWEVMKGSTSYRYMGFGFNRMFFYDNNIAWTGGDREYLAITSNRGGINSPVALFNANTTQVCSSNTVYLENYSAAGYSYKWFRNGILFSTDYNPKYITGTGSDVIKLIVSNGVESDSSIQTINAQGSSGFSFISIPSSTTVCNNGYVDIMIPDSDPQARYEVSRIGWGGAVTATGTGDTLYIRYPQFSTANGPVNLEVWGAKATPCGDKTSHQTHVINVINTTNIQVAASSGTFCPQLTAEIKITNSKKGHAYWADYTQPKVFGNDSTISIYASPASAVWVDYPIDEYHRNYTFRINVQDATHGCQSSNADVVAMSHTNRALFNMFGNTYFVGDTLRLLNQSLSSESYLWSFDNSATSTTKSTFNPSEILYRTAGQKTIKLIASTTEGCKDSATKTVEIFAKNGIISTIDLCKMGTANADSVKGMDYFYPRDIYSDENGNVYTTGGHAPTDKINFYPRGYEGWFASKFDKDGRLKWRLEQDFDYNSVQYDWSGHVITEQIISDNSGNAFIFGHSYGQGYIKDSVNRYRLAGAGSFLMKVNDNGMIEWLKIFYNTSAFGQGSSAFTGGTLLRGGNNDMFIITNVDGGNFYMDGQKITAFDTLKLTGIIMHFDMNAKLLDIKQYPSYYNTIRTGYDNTENYDRTPRGVLNKTGQIVFYANLNPAQIVDNKIDGNRVKFNLKNITSAVLWYDTSTHLITSVQPIYDVNEKGKQVTVKPLAFTVDNYNNYYTSTRTLINLMPYSQATDYQKPVGVLTKYDASGNKVWTKFGSGLDALSMQAVSDKLFVLAQNFVGEGFDNIAMIHYGNESIVFPQTKQLTALYDTSTYVGNGIVGNGSMDVIIARLNASNGNLEAIKAIGSENEQETGALRKGFGDQVYITGSGDYELRSGGEDGPGFYFIVKFPIDHNCDSSSVLPLQLLQFDVTKENNIAKINWRTAHEENIAYFRVQRSYDANNFTSIANVKSKGAGGVLSNYSYEDNLAGIKARRIYYRLEINDADGKKTYSNIQSIDLAQITRLSIYPNPASAFVIINYAHSNNEKEGMVTIRNVLGQAVLNQNVLLSSDNRINISSLAEGTYFLTIATKDNVPETVKLIVR